VFACVPLSLVWTQDTYDTYHCGCRFGNPQEYQDVQGRAQKYRDVVTLETGVKGWIPWTQLPTVDWVHTFLFDAMHLGNNLGNDLLNMMLGGPAFLKGLPESLTFFEMHPSVAADVNTQPWSWPEAVHKEIVLWIKDGLHLPESWSADYKKIGTPNKAKNAKGMKSHTHRALFQCGLYAELANWGRGTCFECRTIFGIHQRKHALLSQRSIL
jgi:hypothetical protein